MRTFLIIILAQLLTQGSFSQPQRPGDTNEYLATIKSDGLKGHVRRVYSITTILADGEKETEEASYNPQGYKLLLLRRPYKSQNEIQKEAYTYDENHRLTRKENIFSTGGYINYHAKYDVQGHLTEEVKSEPEYEEPRRSEYFYDAKGIKEKLCEYNLHEEKPFVCLKYTYNPSGKVEQILHTDEGDNVISREEYKYDKGGRITRRSDYLCSERGCNFDGEEIFTYGEDGKMSRQRKYSSNGSLVWEESYKRLSGKSGRIETMADFQPNHYLKVIERFNRFGDSIWSIQVNEKGVLVRKEKCAYRYDGQGNWLLQKQFVCSVNGGREICRASKNTRRKILYY